MTEPQAPADAAEPAREEQRRARSPWFRALGAISWLGVAVGLFLLARQLDWPRVREAFGEADLRFALAALLLWPVTTTLQATRWWLLAREALPVRLRAVVGAFFVGQAATAVMPLRAGEAVRIELLARSCGASRAVALGTVALDHAVNGVVMFLFALLLPLVLPVPRWVTVLVWCGTAAVALALVLLTRLARSPPALSESRVGGLRGALDRLRGGLHGLKKPRAVFLACAVAALAWTLEIVHTALALATFHLAPSPTHAMGVLFGINLALALPNPPGNLGNFEFAAGLSLVALGGGPAESAAAFALGLHALQLVPTLLGGALWLPFSGRPPVDAASARPALRQPGVQRG